MPKGVGSMQETFQKVIEHDALIHDDILPRLKEMEKVQEEFTKEFTAMRASQTSLELTVMKDGQQTRDLLGKFVEHYFNTDNKKLDNDQKLTLKELDVNQKLSIKRLSTVEKIFLGIAATLGGGGGLFAGIVSLLEYLNK